MHCMIVEALVHATVLGIVAFFILFAAGKAEGFTALLGRVLGYWVLLIAVASLACGIYGGVTGKHLMPMDDHSGWMHREGPAPMGPPPAAAPAPAPKRS